MLLDLKVLNGIMSPEFNSEVLEYVILTDNVKQLDLSFITENDLPVTIYGNDYLTEGENHVLLEIYDEKVITYTLTVYNNNSQEVMQKDDNISKIEISTKDILLDDLLTPGIVSICFMIIIFLYALIFHKKKS